MKTQKFLSAKAHSRFIDLIYEEFTDTEKQYYKRAVNSNGAKKEGTIMNIENLQVLKQLLAIYFNKKIMKE